MKDSLLNLFKDEEAIEPESLRKIDPTLSDLEVLEIITYKVIKETAAVFIDFYVFEDAVHILNGITPDVEKIEGSTPEQIWYALQKIKQIRPDHPPFSHEVKVYVDFIFKEKGILFRPEGLSLNDEESNKKFLNIIKSKKDDQPIKETDEILPMQIIHYLRIEEYINNKVNE